MRRREGLGGKAGGTRAAYRGTGGRQTPGKQLLRPFRRERRCEVGGPTCLHIGLIYSAACAHCQGYIFFFFWCTGSVNSGGVGGGRQHASRLAPTAPRWLDRAYLMSGNVFLACPGLGGWQLAGAAQPQAW